MDEAPVDRPAYGVQHSGKAETSKLGRSLVTRKGKTRSSRSHETEGARSQGIGAWARRSEEAGVMPAEQRSPGCSSDGRNRSRSLNRGVLSNPKTDRAVANRERDKAVFVEGGGRNLHLEPDRGNLAVRDFRGVDGNVGDSWAPTRRRLINSALACDYRASEIDHGITLMRHLSISTCSQ